MCGIIGYVGETDAIDVLLDGLSELEYRGYDSAGVALTTETVHVRKSEGKLEALKAQLSDAKLRGPTTGIGHTRWSTHGPPSDANAHPHTDEAGRVAVVHNGIIENYQSLRDELTSADVAFESDTDTEVIPHLIASFLEAGDDPETAFRRTIGRLEGSYAIAAVFEGRDEIYAARHESPLVLGVGDGGYYLASDVPAFLEYTDRAVYVEDGELVRLENDELVVTDESGTVVEKSVETVDWDAEDTGKSGYDHYMLKEIYEQPTALRQCLRGRVDELAGEITLEELEDIGDVSRVQFVACGTSYHAALYGAELCRSHGVHASTQIASEFAADRMPLDAETLVVGVTQSGETADTLRALREAASAGANTLVVTNTVGSSATRVCDHVLYIRAGPEIGVAATKTFASQQIALTLLAGKLSDGLSYDDIESLRDVPDLVQTVLDTSKAREIAEEILGSDAYLFIGRGLAYPVALEGALKFKEITYEHAEGFAAGELKHGPLALVTDRTPVFAVVTGNDELAQKTISNIKEVEARDAPVVLVTDGQSGADRYADYVLEIPVADELSAAVVANVQLQLISYWVANLMGRSIDKPRNLAKSVTVE